MANSDSQASHMDGQPSDDNIVPEVQRLVLLDMIDSDIDEDYSPVTPEQRMDLQKCSKDNISGTYLGSESASSDLSTKECSETMSSSSSSSSSSDAELITYDLSVEKYMQQHKDNEILKPKVVEAEDENLGMTKIKGEQYEELLEQVANYQVELKFAKKKLQSKQEEIAQLKYENLTLVEELGKTIEKLRASEDNSAKLEEKLRNEFQESRNQLQAELDLASHKIDHLETELGSEGRLVSELQGMLVKTTNDLTDYGREIDELKLALRDAQEDFSKDKSHLQAEITHLREHRDALDGRLKEAELRNQFLEEQIQRSEVERAEMKSLHESQETGLLNEINQLKADLSGRNENVDSLNKSLDASKQQYDMLMAEKDEVFAKLQTLGAEMNNRDIQLRQMSQLTAENEELLAELKKTQNLADELKMKIADQEREVEKQRAVIFDRAEEKREAIRQLCFSLDHYRNGYEELRQAFIKHKRPAIVAL